MAKFPRYSKWSLAAIAGGVAITAIEVYGAVSYLVGQNSPNYLVAGGAVVTVIAAILPILAGRCWGHGRYLLAGLLWLALVPALSVILVAAVERTGGAKDAADRDRQAHELKLSLAKVTVTEAKAQADSLQAKADAECSRTKNPKVSPRGPTCTVAEERSDKAVQALKSARDEVVKIGPPPKDPTAARFAALVPGVTEEAYALVQPLVLPLAVSFTGLLLIAYGAHSPRRRKVKRRVSKRKKRRQPVSPKPSPAKVLPFRRRA